ncbi:MAG: hypothetical protein ABL967_09000 [Bryobacteraceae bacterium]
MRKEDLKLYEITIHLNTPDPARWIASAPTQKEAVEMTVDRLISTVLNAGITTVCLSDAKRTVAHSTVVDEDAFYESLVTQTKGPNLDGLWEEEPTANLNGLFEDEDEIQ